MTRAATLVIAIALLGGCAARDAGLRGAAVHHVVLIALADPADADALIAQSHARLTTIPGVRASFIGRPLHIGRDGVDGDYDVGFYFGFSSAEDYRAYLDHPEHVAMVSEWRSRFSAVRIYDVASESP